MPVFPYYVDVDPRTLRLPTSRLSGADPYKLQVQIARFGTSMQQMQPPLVYRGTDGKLMLSDGVTRATRIAKLLPGVLMRVEVVGDLGAPCGQLPSVEDRIP